MNGYRIDRRRAAALIEHEPGVQLALPGLLAGVVGVVHVLKPLGQDVDAPQMAGLVQALEPSVHKNESLSRSTTTRNPSASACSMKPMAP